MKFGLLFYLSVGWLALDLTGTTAPDSAAVSGAGSLTPPPAGLPTARFETD